MKFVLHWIELNLNKVDLLALGTFSTLFILLCCICVVFNWTLNFN
jgi:hypothetical protein